MALLSFIALGVAASAQAQDPDYHAQGNPITATWSVDHRELAEDETLLATLTIRGATNPQEIVRPELGTMKAFTDQFRRIENGAESRAGEVSFTYRLQPRDPKTNRLPSLDFPYSRPGESRPTQSTRVKGIDLVVTAAVPKPELKPPPVPMTDPEELFSITTGPQVLRREPFSPSRSTWLALLLAGPLVGLTWFLVWRQLYPDAARRAHLQRTRAARRALETLRHSQDAGIVVLRYLRERFQLPHEAVTPADIESSLQGEKVSAENANAVEEFFRQCDAARFAPVSDSDLSLRDEASVLIARLEARA